MDLELLSKVTECFANQLSSEYAPIQFMNGNILTRENIVFLTFLRCQLRLERKNSAINPD